MRLHSWYLMASGPAECRPLDLGVPQGGGLRIVECFPDGPVRFKSVPSSPVGGSKKHRASRPPFPQAGGGGAVWVGTRPLLRFSLAASDHFLFSLGRRQLWPHSWQPSRPRPRRPRTLLKGLPSWAQGTSPPQLPSPPPKGLPRARAGWGGVGLAGSSNSLSAKQQTLTLGLHMG